MKATPGIKAAMYVCFAVLALALFIGLMALSSLRAVDMGVPHAIVPFSASSTSGIMLLMGPVLVAWALSVKVRCSDRFVRCCLVTVALLFAVWMLLVVLKYACAREHWRFVTVCWYYFYVPIILAPALCLASALRIASFPARVVRWTTRALLVAAALLILLVFTNSLHYQVFRFDYSDPAWQANYTYQIGYRIITVWQIALTVAFLALILYVSRARLWKAAAVVGVFALLLLVYALMYRLRIESVFKSNFALSYVAAFTILMELCLDFGIFPSFARYRRLFEDLPFDINVFSNDAGIAFRTKGATVPCVEATMLVRRLADNRSLRGIAYDAKGDRQFLAWCIPGGVALLTEDRADLNERARRIHAEREALERGNRLLRMEIELKGEAACIDSEVELVGEIRASLAKTFKIMYGLLNELREPLDAVSEEDTRGRLQRLRFLVAYCKRKSSLLLMEKGGEDYDKERLLLVANELAADARASGIECAAFVDRPAAVAHGALSAVYDCLYNIIMLCFELDHPVLLISSTRRDEGHLGIDVVLEYDDAFFIEAEMVDEQLLAPLEGYGLEYRLSSGVHGFALSFAVPIARPRGGDGR